MRKTISASVVGSILLLLPLAFFSSCVNDKYELSEENLDLNVTIFQEGVSIPLGSTLPITLGNLIEKLDLGEDFGKYFEEGADGGYSITLGDSFDVSEELSSLTDIISLQKIGFQKDMKFSLQNVDVSKISIPAIDYPYEKKLSEVVTIPDVELPQLAAQTLDVNAGLHELDVNMELLNSMINEHAGDVSVEDVVAKISQSNLSGSMVNDRKVAIDDDFMGYYNLELMETFSMDKPFEYNLDVDFPKGITDISEVSFTGSQVTITMRIGESFFAEGYIKPTLYLDFHDVFHLTEAENSKHPLTPDAIEGVFDLSHENGWTATRTFGIESLVLNEGDIFMDEEEGILKLRKKVKLAPSGKLSYHDLFTTTRLMSEHDEVRVFVEVKFRDLNIDDVVFSAETELPVEQNVTLAAPPMALPEQVESLGTISFTEDSRLRLSMSAQNMMHGLDVEMETLEFTFPQSLKVLAGEGYTVTGNKVKVNGQKITSAPSAIDINVSGFTLPAPENGEIAINEKVKVVANVRADIRDMRLSSLPTSAANDLKFHVEVLPDLQLDDCTLKIKEEGFTINQIVGEINEKLPDNVKDLKVVTVYLENNPSISLDVELPDLDEILGINTQLEIVPAYGGMAVCFPEMMRFPTTGGHMDYYNHAKHALEFKTGFHDVSFPIEKLEIVPVKEGNSAYMRGNIRIEGGVSLTGGEISYKQLKKIVESDDATISFRVQMPELSPKELNVGQYEMSAGRMEYDIDFLNTVDVPEMIDKIQRIELDNVKFFVDVEASDLPSLGSDATITFDVAVSLPSFVKFDETDDRVSNGAVNLSIVGRTVDGKFVFDAEPLKINALDLSDVDLRSSEPIDQKVVMDATLKLNNASLSDDWFGKEHVMNINAYVMTDKEYAPGEEEVIAIKSVSGNIDYAIEPIEQTIDLSSLSGMLNGDNVEAVIDINRFYLALDIRTNLGVSANADLKITPYYNDVPDLNRVVAPDEKIVLSAVGHSSDTTTTSLWISNSSTGMPSGYKFIELDFLSLLKDIPDYIKVELAAGTDKKDVCLFEPGAKYILKANYTAGIPLEFGEDFKLVYRDTIPDIPSEIADILAYGSLGLGGSVESSIPLNFSMGVNFLDSNGRIIEMGDAAGRQLIKAGGASGNVVITPIDLVISKKEGVDYSDISSIEIVFRADAKGAVGIPLRKDNSLKFTLNARIPEGLTLDLDDTILTNAEEIKE